MICWGLQVLGLPAGQEARSLPLSTGLEKYVCLLCLGTVLLLLLKAMRSVFDEDQTTF